MQNLVRVINQRPWAKSWIRVWMERGSGLDLLLAVSFFFPFLLAGSLYQLLPPNNGRGFPKIQFVWLSDLRTYSTRNTLFSRCLLNTHPFLHLSIFLPTIMQYIISIFILPLIFSLDLTSDLVLFMYIITMIEPDNEHCDLMEIDFPFLPQTSPTQPSL